MKFETTMEFDVQVIATVSKPVRPTRCSDPDSPGFSDPGDPGGVDIEAVLLCRKGRKDLDIFDYLLPSEVEDLEQACMDEALEGEG